MKNLIKQSPVWVIHGVTAVIAWLGSFLVLHGVLTHTESSALVQEIAPTVAGAAVIIVGALVSKYVVPAAKWIDHEAAKLAPGLAPAIEGSVDSSVATLESAFNNAETQVFPAVPAAPAATA